MIKLAVFGSFAQEHHCRMLEGFFDAVKKKADAIDVFIDPEFRDYLGKGCVDVSATRILTDRELPSCDMAVSFGGDGTFLRVAARIAPLELPIVGINTGHLGYLASVSPSNPERVVQRIISGNYRVERRTMLCATNPKANGDDVEPIIGIALNEIAVLKQDSASVVSVDARLNGEPLAVYRADGLIVSTPTGSTGYNLSAGGPIAAPGTNVWVVSPIAAHTLTMRPMVVADSSEIEMCVESRSGSFLLSFDGNSIVLPSKSAIKVSKAPFVTNIVLANDRSFADTLREKLLWGV